MATVTGDMSPIVPVAWIAELRISITGYYRHQHVGSGSQILCNTFTSDYKWNVFCVKYCQIPPSLKNVLLQPCLSTIAPPAYQSICWQRECWLTLELMNWCASELGFQGVRRNRRIRITYDVWTVIHM